MKDILKKPWLWVIIVLVAFIAINVAVSDEDTGQKTAFETETSTPKPTSQPEQQVEPQETISVQTTEPKETVKPKKVSKKKKIKDTIKERIYDEYYDTTIDHITINDNLGTKKKGDYIALVYLIWDVKNGPEMTKEMISMYSEDLAAYVGKHCKKVEEIAIFWEATYIEEKAKIAYKRYGKGMYESDSFFGYGFWQ